MTDQDYSWGHKFKIRIDCEWIVIPCDSFESITFRLSSNWDILINIFTMSHQDTKCYATKSKQTMKAKLSFA